MPLGTHSAPTRAKKKKLLENHGAGLRECMSLGPASWPAERLARKVALVWMLWQAPALYEFAVEFTLSCFPE